MTIYQPDGDIPAPAVLEKISSDVRAVEEEMRAAGAWGSPAACTPSTATVLDPRRDKTPMTDGPYVEGKEHVGSLSIIKAESLDAALAWVRKVARATRLPVEVRPFQGELED